MPPHSVRLSAVTVFLLGTAHALVCSPLAHGAVGDGSKYDTAAVRAAVDECGSAGGGVVVFPKNHTFLTGSFNISSHVWLQVDGTILGSPNNTDYVLVDFLPWYGPDPPQAVASRVDAADTREWSPLIQSWFSNNVSIFGNGTIDGNGELWWRCADSGKASTPPCSGYPRPHGVRLVGGTGFEISGITLKDSPMWQLHLAYTTDVWVHDMSVTAPESPTSHNTDGIDPDCAVDVVIERVHIATGDDNIAIKSGRNWYGRTFGRTSRNITVRDSTFGVGHGLSIGSEMSGGVEDVLFSNITGVGLATGIRIKSERGRGGVVSNVHYRDITLKDIQGAAVQMTMNYDPGLPPTNVTATPSLINVTVENVVSSNSGAGWTLDGLPESLLRGLVFRNLSIGVTSSKHYIQKCDYVDTASAVCEGVTPSCPPCLNA